MNAPDTIRELILTYPSIFPNKLYAARQVLLTIGGGYYWENGALVDHYREGICHTVEESIIRLRHRRDQAIHEVEMNHQVKKKQNIWLDVSFLRTDSLKMIDQQYEALIQIVRNVDAQMEDMSIIMQGDLFWKFPLRIFGSENLFNVPEDVTISWQKLCKETQRFFVENPSAVEKRRMFRKIRNLKFPK